MYQECHHPPSRPMETPGSQSAPLVPGEGVFQDASSSKVVFLEPVGKIPGSSSLKGGHGEGEKVLDLAQHPVCILVTPIKITVKGSRNKHF